MGAQISMALSDYDALREQVKEANERASKLARDLDAALRGLQPTETVDLRALIREAVPALAHGLANLGPEISTWPVDAVRAWAAIVDAVAGTNDGAMREMAIDIRAFANECEKFQARKKV